MKKDWSNGNRNLENKENKENKTESRREYKGIS